jgi:hypothetical protein
LNIRTNPAKKKSELWNAKNASNLLFVLPLIFNRAKKVPSDVILETTFHTRFRSEGGSRSILGIQPTSKLDPVNIITAGVVCSLLELKILCEIMVTELKNDNIPML